MPARPRLPAQPCLFRIGDGFVVYDATHVCDASDPEDIRIAEAHAVFADVAELMRVLTAWAYRFDEFAPPAPARSAGDA